MTHGIIVKLREFHIPLLAETATMTFCGLPSLHKSLRDSVKVFLSPVCQSDICAAIPNPVSIPELAYQVGKVRSGLTSDNTHCVLRSLEWGNALWTLKLLSFYGKLNLKNLTEVLLLILVRVFLFANIFLFTTLNSKLLSKYTTNDYIDTYVNQVNKPKCTHSAHARPDVKNKTLKTVTAK